MNGIPIGRLFNPTPGGGYQYDWPGAPVVGGSTPQGLIRQLGGGPTGTMVTPTSTPTTQQQPTTSPISPSPLIQQLGGGFNQGIAGTMQPQQSFGGGGQEAMFQQLFRKWLQQYMMGGMGSAPWLSGGNFSRF